MSIKKALAKIDGQKTILVQCETKSLQNAVIDTVEYAVKVRKWVCIYVCLNKPYSKLEQDLKKKKLDPKKIFCIDCMSELIKEKEDRETVLYIKSPADLTKIDLSIKQLSQFVGSDGCIIIDSLQTLLIYNDPFVVARFVHSVLSETNEFGMRAILFASKETNKEIVDQISPFFDNFIEC